MTYYSAPINVRRPGRVRRWLARKFYQLTYLADPGFEVWEDWGEAGYISED